MGSVEEKAYAARRRRWRKDQACIALGVSAVALVVGLTFAGVLPSWSRPDASPAQDPLASKLSQPHSQAVYE